MPAILSGMSTIDSGCPVAALDYQRGGIVGRAGGRAGAARVHPEGGSPRSGAVAGARRRRAGGDHIGHRLSGSSGLSRAVDWAVEQMEQFGGAALGLEFEIYAAEHSRIELNDPEAAGQSVWHAHIHVIPRFKGDTPNPKGGVRHVIPLKGGY